MVFIKINNKDVKIHAFIQQMFIECPSLVGTILGAGGTAKQQQNNTTSPFSWSLHFSREETDF